MDSWVNILYQLSYIILGSFEFTGYLLHLIHGSRDMYRPGSAVAHTWASDPARETCLACQDCCIPRAGRISLSAIYNLHGLYGL